MWQYILSAVIAFSLTALAGKIFIPLLVKLKFGQSILEIGPNWHMSKQGTPTMGGIIFVLPIAITILIVGIPQMLAGNFKHLLVFAFALAFGVIGFIDDYAKITKKQNKGLSALQKLLLQIAASAAFLSALRFMGDFSSELYIPFIDTVVEIPWLIYLIFMIFVAVAMVNAVNLTDGIDGLASCVTVPVMMFFVIISMVFTAPALGVLSSAVMAALFGFLIYNFNPARVFMGDTGSLFLGGMVCGLAFAFNIPLILIPVGIIYIVETVSVILQVSYFKLTHGKRLFKMAPIHHHFEMKGWSEKKLCFVFTLVTFIGCIVAYIGLFTKYIF